jgi:hypothetical protein
MRNNYHDGSSGVQDILASDKALGGLHGNGAHGVLSEMLGDLEHDTGATLGNLHLEGIEDRGQGAIELRCM